MATTKITDLTAYTDPVNTDVLPIVDVTSDVTKKVSIANVMKNASLGSNTAPGIAFDGDPNTGIYSPGADQVAVTTGGTARLTATTTGITSTLPIIVPDGSAAAPSIAFTGSGTDTGVYSPGADQLALATGGSGRLFINSSGQVGIGTSSPSNTLHVVGPAAGVSARFTDNTNSTLQISHATAGQVTFLAGDNSSMLELGNTAKFYASGTERLRITSAGLVGIGTSSPSASALLDVNGNARIGSAGNFDTDTRLLVASTGGNSYIQIQGADSTGVVGLKLGRNSSANNAGIDWSASTDKLTFRTGGTNAAVTIDSSQRVGIGTTSPAVTLHAQGTIRASRSNGELKYLDIYHAGGEGFIDSVNGDAPTVAPIVFRTGNNSSTSERARIDSSGRLLVGTSSTSANATLVLQGQSAGSTAHSRLWLCKGESLPASGNVLGELVFGDSNQNPFAIISSYVDAAPGAGDYPSRLVFSTTADGASSPTERMRITNAGNVLINKTVDEGQRLQVVHSADTLATIATFANNAATTANQYGNVLYLNGDPNNTSQYFFRFIGASTERTTIRSNGGLANFSANNVNLSDRNVKKDIAPAAGTWDCLKEWEIVKFRYKDQADDTDLNMGVIAQQVAESCPEVITVFQEAKEATDDQPAQEERIGVKEQQMMWMAIKALQEAQLRIETLEAEVAALKAQ